MCFCYKIACGTKTASLESLLANMIVGNLTGCTYDMETHILSFVCSKI